MSSFSITRRVERLEGALAAFQPYNMLIWPEGQPLAEALADAGLSLDDNLIVVDFVAVGPDGGPVRCPIHKRDRHLLDRGGLKDQLPRRQSVI